MLAQSISKIPQRVAKSRIWNALQRPRPTSRFGHIRALAPTSHTLRPLTCPLCGDLSIREVCEVAVAGACRVVARRCTYRATDASCTCAMRYRTRHKSHATLQRQQCGRGCVFGVQRLRSWCPAAQGWRRKGRALGGASRGAREVGGLRAGWRGRRRVVTETRGRCCWRPSAPATTGSPGGVSPGRVGARCPRSGRAAGMPGRGRRAAGRA
jgi:hypothetical protein